MGDFISCAVTGHRPSRLPYRYNEFHPKCAELKLTIARQLELLRRQGVTDYYTGCAQGVDTWAGEAVLALMKMDENIRLHCIVPFSGQESGWPDSRQERYNKMLQRASDVELISAQYSKGSYYARNRVLVERADILLAVFDRDDESRSGTGYTVAYAEKKNKPIIFIHPSTLEISRLNF